MIKDCFPKIHSYIQFYFTAVSFTCSKGQFFTQPYVTQNRYSYSDKAATKAHACCKILSTQNPFTEITVYPATHLTSTKIKLN